MATDPTFDGTGLRVLNDPELRANVRESIAASLLGPDFSTGPYSIVGMLLDSIVPEMTDIYDLDEALYQGWDLDSAEGTQLDNIGSLNGLTRQAATRSVGAIDTSNPLTLSGVAATVIPLGNKFRVPDGEEVRLTAEVTIGGGGTVEADYEAVNAGPLSFGIGSITEIVDAVGGLTGVTNAAAATVGDAQETDSEYRARIKRSQSAIGSSTDFAIRSRLEDLDDVTAAAAVSNRTLTTDANGTPGKTVWIIVDGTAEDVDIARTIWGPAGLPAGIDSRGANEAVVTDSNGYDQTVRWDDAELVQTWITATLTTNDDYPIGGDQLVEDAIVAWGASNLNLAGTIEPQPIDTYVATQVPGIAKLVITLSITGVPGPGDTDPIAVAINQRAEIDAADVAVVST